MARNRKGVERGPQVRVASLACAYNEERFIGPHLDMLAPYVDESLVLISSTPWHGDTYEPDRTEEIAESRGATVVVHDWADGHIQRNAGLDFLYQYDWVLIPDPDEFILAEDMEKMLRELETAEGDAYATDRMFTYWKSGYRIDPPESHTPIIAVRPSVRFYEIRCVSGPWSILKSRPLVHHFSYARTDAEVWKKIHATEHAVDFDTDKWYREVWEPWTPESEDLHPLTPPDYKRAVPVRLPKELQGLWPTGTT